MLILGLVLGQNIVFSYEIRGWSRRMFDTNIFLFFSVNCLTRTDFFTATSSRTNNRFATVHIHPFRSRETRLFDAAEKIVEEEKLVEDIAEKTLEQKQEQRFSKDKSSAPRTYVDRESSPEIHVDREPSPEIYVDREPSPQTYVERSNLRDMKLSMLPTSIEDDDIENQVEEVNLSV